MHNSIFALHTPQKELTNLSVRNVANECLITLTKSWNNCDFYRVNFVTLSHLNIQAMFAIWFWSLFITNYWQDTTLSQPPHLLWRAWLEALMTSFLRYLTLVNALLMVAKRTQMIANAPLCRYSEETIGKEAVNFRPIPEGETWRHFVKCQAA